jgi:hypothetical protein
MEDYMSGIGEKKIIYFDSQGEHNTDGALDAAVAYCRQLNTTRNALKHELMQALGGR